MILDSRNPLELSENSAYQILSGIVHLFVTKKPEQDVMRNKRLFLMSIPEGTTIIGHSILLEGEIHNFILIGSGKAEVGIVSLDSNDLPKDGLVKWLKCLNHHVDEKATIELNDMPVVTFIQLVKQSTSDFMKKKIVQTYRTQLLENELYKKQCEMNKTTLAHAVDLLKPEMVVSEDHILDTPYFKACYTVLNYLGRQVKTFDLPSDAHMECHTLLKIYFQKMNVKYRQIILDERWWESGYGALIAFDDKSMPRAILPDLKNGYVISDGDSGKNQKINSEIASKFSKKAYMIYRDLPSEAVSSSDLIQFGLKDLKSSDLSILGLSILGIGVLGMVLPILTGLMVDWIIPQGNCNLLTQMGLILGIVAVVSFLFNLTRGFVTLRIEGKLDGTLQTAIWDRLLHLPLSFFKQFTSAELASRALGITLIRDIISGPVIAMMLTSIYAVFSWMVLFYYSVPLALVVSLMTIVCMLVNQGFFMKILKEEEQINQMTNTLSGLTFQLIKGAIKIQHSGATERAFYKWSKQQSQKHHHIREKGVYFSKMEAFNGFYLPMTMAVIYHLITKVSFFKLEVGAFVGFNAAYLMLTTAIISIFGMMATLTQVIPLYNRGKIILETVPENVAEKPILEKPSGKITVDHVVFKYNDESPEILKDISLEIKPREYVGIVGTSGSGKSTLLRLLLGFEVSGSGKITYDDKDINSIDMRDLRKKIGSVLQTGKLMNDSIYQNIVGAHLHLTLDEVWQAATIAGIADDISAMPMGMHTMVMEGTGTISGGQKQRILIARAIVNKPSILFFDEATSALDNITQQKIKESLDQFPATRVVIAHRLSTVKKCDRIIVLDKGLIKEEGNYETLMAQKGIFYELAKRQLA